MTKAPFNYYYGPSFHKDAKNKLTQHSRFNPIKRRSSFLLYMYSYDFETNISKQRKTMVALSILTFLLERTSRTCFQMRVAKVNFVLFFSFLFFFFLIRQGN